MLESCTIFKNMALIIYDTKLYEKINTSNKSKENHRKKKLYPI